MPSVRWLQRVLKGLLVLLLLLFLGVLKDVSDAGFNRKEVFAGVLWFVRRHSGEGVHEGVRASLL